MQRIDNSSDDEMENALNTMAAGGSDALKQAVDGIIKAQNEGYEFFKKVVDEASTHLSPKANQKLQNEKQLVFDRKLSQEEFDKKLAAIESNPDVEEELKSANLDKRVLDFHSFANDFFELDKNNDGFVSLEELNTEQAKKADINEDGKLSPYEYEELKSANLDKRVFDFHSFANDFFELDKNNDGFVSLEELNTEQAKKADINGDGKLSPYEYVRMG
uniref:EF-hand domain-containing protein n=1 Tax=Globodera pallida TaxID=36090 RepID=A0A183BZ72_GLOPA